MRIRQLRGLPVVDPLAARKVGTITDFLVDPARRRLAGVVIRPRESDASATILAEQVQRVGRDAVMLRGHYHEDAALPFGAFDRWLDTGTLVGLEVLGDDGDAVGRLADAYFDQDTLEVESYVLARRTWWPWARRHIRPDQVFSCSRDLMVLATGRVAHEPEAVDEGVSQMAKQSDAIIELPGGSDNGVALPGAPRRQVS